MYLDHNQILDSSNATQSKEAFRIVRVDSLHLFAKCSCRWNSRWNTRSAGNIQLYSVPRPNRRNRIIPSERPKPFLPEQRAQRYIHSWLWRTSGWGNLTKTKSNNFASLLVWLVQPSTLHYVRNQKYEFNAWLLILRTQLY